MSLVTLKEKVEKLIDKAEYENAMYEASKEWTTQFNALFNGNKQIKRFPRLSFENATTLRWLCPYSTVETIDYYINSEKATIADVAFRDCELLVYMVGVCLSKVGNANSLFNGCVSLETIEEPLDLSSSTNNNIIFWRCYALKNVRFVAESIKCSIVFGMETLTAESKQSIFDGLATVSTAQTLTLAPNLKILQSQVDSANAKGWTVAGGTVVSEEEYYG